MSEVPVVAEVRVAAPIEAAEVVDEVVAAKDDAAVLAWPDGVPVLVGAVVVEVAGISANVGDSPAGATYVDVEGALHATAIAWIAAARERGFRVLAERADDDVHVASLVDGAGRRAHLLLQRDDVDSLAGMFGFAGAANPQVALAGKCGEVPLRSRGFDVDRGAITHGGGYRRERSLMRVRAQFGHDFDGDGELDALVPTADPATCPDDVLWTVYLARGECAHAVGTVGPGALDAGIEAGTGPRPLVFRAQTNALGDGGVVATRVTTTYTFNKKLKKYVRSGQTRDVGVCHHCPVATCAPAL